MRPGAVIVNSRRGPRDFEWKWQHHNQRVRNVFGQYGRGRSGEQSGLGGILVTGSGETNSGSTTLGCCSAIRAEINNPANSSGVIVNRSGEHCRDNVMPPRASSDMHALTAGTGNVIVTGGAGATMSNTGLFGIDAEAYGPASTGSINASTGILSAIKVDGTGIFAANSAVAIPTSAGSTIAVTNNGTIASGSLPNPVGAFLGEGGGVTAMPAGILAGYGGGPIFGPASEPLYLVRRVWLHHTNPEPAGQRHSQRRQQCRHQRGRRGRHFCVQFRQRQCFGERRAEPITVTGATSQNGIEAFSAEVGNISVTTAANVTSSNGSGIQTNSVGVGTTTINVLAGIDPRRDQRGERGVE